MNTGKSTIYSLACALAIATPLAFAQKTDKQDAGALRAMLQANMAEVEAGKLASQKAQSPEVKQFAQKMIEDHSKKLEDLKSLAQTKGVEVPKAPAAKQQAAMKKLQGVSGEEFDRAYMAQMVKDHGEVLQRTRKIAREAKDGDLKAAAQKSAPGTEEHLKMARQLAGATGAKSK
jgi:putative membrane protein